jgi:hypothetical protein
MVLSEETVLLRAPTNRKLERRQQLFSKGLVEKCHLRGKQHYVFKETKVQPPINKTPFLYIFSYQYFIFYILTYDIFYLTHLTMALAFILMTQRIR